MKNAVSFREATIDDVPSIVAMLADDELGAQRERLEEPLPQSYYDAFAAIDESTTNELILACQGERPVGVLQLTLIPYLTYQGGWRALIEGVRVAREVRVQGIGRQLFEWAIGRARERGCHIVQLTTDKSRRDAHAFYQSLGFVASHDGMKLHLSKNE